MIEEKIRKTLELIFDNFVESSDRLALMSYGKNTKKMFNLVQYENNKIQLRNQIHNIKMKEGGFHP